MASHGHRNVRATRLYERGYSRERVVSLFRFIDWLLEVPATHEALFWREIQAYERERTMPYVTSVERIGLARGREEGLREALRRIVRARFGVVPEALETRIAAADRTTLDHLIDRASVVQTVDDL